MLGTEPGDLGGLISGLDRVVRGLGRNEQTLQNLVTNFRIFSGSFAAEDVALGRAIEELPNTLEAAEPGVREPQRARSRRCARSPARRCPGVRATPETLRAATPFVAQVRALVSERELRGLVADLRPTIPKLALLAAAHAPVPRRRPGRSSSCFNEVVIPWAQRHGRAGRPGDQYPHEPVGRVFEETAYGLTGIAGESRSGDANGQYIRVSAGGGTNTVKIPNAVPASTGRAPGRGRPDAVPDPRLDADDRGLG